MIRTHYGVEVRREWSQDSIRSKLEEKGISYIDLPINSKIDVITYIEDNIKYFSLMIPQELPEEVAWYIYTTERTPDDCDWLRLAMDIDNQCDNAGLPMQMRTRLKLAIDVASMEIEEENWDKIFEEKDPVELAEEYIEFLKEKLLKIGYSGSVIMEMPHHDVAEWIFQALTR